MRQGLGLYRNFMTNKNKRSKVKVKVKVQDNGFTPPYYDQQLVDALIAGKPFVDYSNFKQTGIVRGGLKEFFKERWNPRKSWVLNISFGNLISFNKALVILRNLTLNTRGQFFYCWEASKFISKQNGALSINFYLVNVTDKQGENQYIFPGRKYISYWIKLFSRLAELNKLEVVIPCNPFQGVTIQRRNFPFGIRNNRYDAEKIVQRTNTLLFNPLMASLSPVFFLLPLFIKSTFEQIAKVLKEEAKQRNNNIIEWIDEIIPDLDQVGADIYRETPWPSTHYREPPILERFYCRLYNRRSEHHTGPHELPHNLTTSEMIPRLKI